METKLNVVVLSHTPEFEQHIVRGARLCYSSANIEELRDKVKSYCSVLQNLAKIIAELDMMLAFSKVANENKTLATITFQNYFRLYKKLKTLSYSSGTSISTSSTSSSFLMISITFLAISFAITLLVESGQF